MNKTSIIIQREYLSRITNKTFIFLTILGPIIYALFIIIPILVANISDGKTQVAVVDESGMFINKLKNSDNLEFIYENKSLDQLNQELKKPNGDLENVLFIPKSMNLYDKKGIELYSKSKLGLGKINDIEDELSSEIKELKLTKLNIKQSTIDSLSTDLKIQVKEVTETGVKDSSSEAAFATGYGLGFLMYFFILLYGSLVLRSVQEEKQNRVVEVLISSVRPYQLMMGKIVGVALVGLTQFVVWIALSFIVSLAVKGFISTPDAHATQQIVGQAQQVNPMNKQEMASGVMKAISTLNIPLIVGCFIFYFLSGYLLYSALFAAAASAADSQQDTQQFMLPISIPIIISIMCIGVIVNSPEGGLAVGLSIFPLTAPIIMMARIGFGVPAWQLIASMISMILAFMGSVWLAAKIYRTGILMYGKKVNFKEIAKWIRY
jgi:ABC-2 type transport system permease protein